MVITALLIGTLVGYTGAGLALALGWPLWAVALSLAGGGSLATLAAALLLVWRQTPAAPSLAGTPPSRAMHN